MPKIAHECSPAPAQAGKPVLLNLSFWFLGEDFAFMLLILLGIGIFKFFSKEMVGSAHPFWSEREMKRFL